MNPPTIWSRAKPRIGVIRVTESCLVKSVNLWTQSSKRSSTETFTQTRQSLSLYCVLFLDCFRSPGLTWLSDWQHVPWWLTKHMEGLGVYFCEIDVFVCVFGVYAACARECVCVRVRLFCRAPATANSRERGQQTDVGGEDLHVCLYKYIFLFLSLFQELEHLYLLCWGVKTNF